MIGEKALVELLSKAMDQGFFQLCFLEALGRKISEYLQKRTTTSRA